MFWRIECRECGLTRWAWKRCPCRIIRSVMLAYGGHWFVSGLMEQTHLSSATVYNALWRMESLGIVESDWATPEGVYPRRRWYRLAEARRHEEHA